MDPRQAGTIRRLTSKDCGLRRGDEMVMSVISTSGREERVRAADLGIGWEW